MKKLLTCILSIILLFTSSVPLSVVAETTASIDNKWPTPPSIVGKTAILMDVDTGAILYNKGMNDKMYPASITKIMTALLALENLKTSDTITVTAEDIASLSSDAAILGIQAGEILTLNDALHGLILRSANEIAVAIANTVAGNVDNFADMMNNRAKEAGALATHFANPHGLYEDDHYTTAYDMAMIAKSAISNSSFSQLWGDTPYVMSPTNMNTESYTIWHRHRMFTKTSSFYYEYALGGKTGYTDESGNTLVTYAKKGDMSLICVVLGSDTDNVYTDTKSLFEYGFNNFTLTNISSYDTTFSFKNNTYFNSIGVTGSSSTPSVKISTDDSIDLPNGLQFIDLTSEVKMSSDSSDSNIATVEYSYNGYFLGKASLSLSLSKNNSFIYNTPTESNDTISDDGVFRINIWYISGGIIAIAIIIFIVYKISKSPFRRKRFTPKRKKLR